MAAFRLKKKHGIFDLMPSHILYEDEALIVVNKPVGLPTQATLDPSRDHLFATVKRYIDNRDKKNNAYVGLHHRLDRDTSGAVLMTKKKSANLFVSNLFKEKQIQKTYLAVCENVSKTAITSRWSIKNHLGRVGKRQWKVLSVQSGGDFAHTDFNLMQTWGNYHLIKAYPRTGRTHQIRVHLSEMGLPILGDTLYGLPKECHKRLMLHAFALDFDHPNSKKNIHIEAPFDELWQETIYNIDSE